jgi:H+/gluconate symporter-like permease
LTDLIQSQLLDPFRIGLLAALVVTMLRTAQVTGRLIPLALGAVFVAVIIPSTNPPTNATLTNAVLAGLVSNAIILGIILALAAVVRRMRG